MVHELAANALRHTVDPEMLGVQTTAELTPLEGIVGQARAVSALEFGLGIQNSGFNIYVAGPRGIGKMTAVQSFLDARAREKPTPDDWCYVNNFADPYQPQALALPPGRARPFAQDVERLIQDARREIPKAFEGEPYRAKREQIKSGYEQKREAALLELSQEASKAGFTIEATPLGIALIPVVQGKQLTEEQFTKLAVAEREDLQRRHAELQSQLSALLKAGRELERTARQELEELDKQIALSVVGGLIEDLEEHYATLPQVTAYLTALKQDILDHFELFKSPQALSAGASEAIPAPAPWMLELPFRKYRVNVVADAATRLQANAGWEAAEPRAPTRSEAAHGAPVVVELNPSYTNLFGRIEKEMHMGALYTDLTLIKGGTLHQANGSYLVLPVEDLLREPFSWDGLKRALRAHAIEIEEPGERLGLLTTKTLRPQPIPLSVKIVLVGRPMLYSLLHELDDDFPELFKVKADFDTEMDDTPENRRDFMAFIATLCAKEDLKPLDRAAMAGVLEHGARLAEDQGKLSTHFGALADVIREANYWATRQASEVIHRAHVQCALEQQVYRSSLIQQRIQELIVNQTLLVETTGACIGQVNGLSLMRLGDHWFGRPSRITASVAPGREGIVDIEREVALGGPIHSKGVLILGGYLMHMYAQKRLLTLNARLVMEQSYEGVEGDSASAAELYALLSALSGVPLKQSIAVTGSVNQHGQVQAIGGVNEKIEGFFDVCRAVGLSGEQGVLFPASNTHNLMLRQDVVDAVRDGQFHLWAVETIDQGLEVLTGQSAGQRDVLSEFPENTINARVEERLEEFACRLKDFGKVSGANGRGEHTLIPHLLSN